MVQSLYKSIVRGLFLNFIFATAFFFAGSTVLFADEVLVWEKNVLGVENNQLVIYLEDGSVLRIENYRAEIKKRGEGTLARSSIHLLAPKKKRKAKVIKSELDASEVASPEPEEPKFETKLELALDPKGGTSNYRVGIWNHSQTQKGLILLNSEAGLDSSKKGGTIKIYTYSLTLKDKSKNSYRLNMGETGSPPVGLDLGLADPHSFFINQTALSTPEKGSSNDHFLGLFMFDKYAGRLSGLRLQYADDFFKRAEADLIRFDLTALGRIFDLPATFTSGDPFQKFADLSVASEIKSITITPKSSLASSKISLGIGVTTEASASEDPLELKDDLRIRWANSVEGAREIYDSQKADLTGIEARSFAKRIVNESMATHVRNRTDRYWRILTVPEDVLMVMPDLRQALAKQTIDGIAEQLGSESHQLTLLAIPENTTSISVANLSIRSLLHNFKTAESKSQFLIVDSLSTKLGGSWDSGSTVLKVDENLNANVADLDGMRLDIIELLPERSLEKIEGRFRKSMDESAKSGEARIFTYSLMDMIADPLKFEIVEKLLLKKYDLRMSRESISAFVTELRKELPVDPLQNLDLAITRIVAIATNLQMRNLNSPDIVRTMIDKYRKLAGDRTPAEFSDEIIDRAFNLENTLSNSNPTHIDPGMDGRERQLKAFGKKIGNWMKRGRLTRARGPIITLLGDNGVGKTMLVDRAASPEALNAKVATVNMTAVSKSVSEVSRFKPGSDSTYNFSEIWIPPEDRILDILKEKIEGLILDPNPVKILFIDEVHAFPSILKFLLSSAGDGDAKKGAALNFDGITVVLGMNVNKTDLYKTLVNMSADDPKWVKSVGDLFQESFEGLTKQANMQIDEKVIAALRGRLLSDMIFFPPISSDKDQRESLVQRLIRDLEKSNQIKIIVQPEAMDELNRIVTEFETGNYRAVERSIKTALEEGIVYWLRKNKQSDLKTRGVFSFQVVKGSTGRDFRMESLSTDPEALAQVINDNYKRLSDRIKTALEIKVAQLKDEVDRQEGLDRENPLTQLRAHTMLLEAFDYASSRSLFHKSQNKFEMIVGTNGVYGANGNAKDLVEQGATVQLLSQRASELFLNIYKTDQYDNLRSKPEKVDELVETICLFLLGVSDVLTNSNLELGHVFAKSNPDWLNSYLQEFVTQRMERRSSNRSELIVQFLNHYLESWIEMAKKSKTEQKSVSPASVATFALSFKAALSDLEEKTGETDHEAMEKFLHQLVSDEVDDARNFIAQIQGPNTAALGMQDRISKIEPASKAPIAAAYLFDHMIREAAKGMLTSIPKTQQLNGDHFRLGATSEKPKNSDEHHSNRCSELTKHLARAREALDSAAARAKLSGR